VKKFITKILFFGTFCVLFMTIISVTIDPYNVFHTDNLRDNGIEQNSNYIKMTYILKNPEKYDAFLFGSSRVGSIHTENIDDVNCYNMTYSEGLPLEHLNNLRTLVSNGIIPKRVYLGIDSLSYTLNPTDHYEEPLRLPYEYIKENPIDFLLMYMDPQMALDSLETTKNYTPVEGYADHFYTGGWWCDYEMECLINETNSYAVIGDDFFMNDVLDQIAEMKDICEKNNIEFIVFTNPMHHLTQTASGITYLNFLEKLTAITDYYNFSGINDITVNNDYFVDTSHYNAETGDLMMEFLAGNIPNSTLYEQGFGRYVTKDNIDDLLSLLHSQYPYE